MHVVTKKGMGYEPAERRPDVFHGVGPFDLATGEVKKSSSAAPKYTSVFGKALVREAAANEDIVAITAAMKDGTGLNEFAENSRNASSIRALPKNMRSRLRAALPLAARSLSWLFIPRSCSVRSINWS